MIRSEFVIRDNKISSFSIEGHSGLAPAGSDVLCASVSAMAMLVLNTVSEVYGAALDLAIEEDLPRIFCRIQSVPEGREEGVQGSLKGLLLQLQDLEKSHPANLSVRTKT